MNYYRAELKAGTIKTVCALCGQTFFPVKLRPRGDFQSPWYREVYPTLNFSLLLSHLRTAHKIKDARRQVFNCADHPDRLIKGINKLKQHIRGLHGAGWPLSPRGQAEESRLRNEADLSSRHQWRVNQNSKKNNKIVGRLTLGSNATRKAAKILEWEARMLGEPPAAIEFPVVNSVRSFATKLGWARRKYNQAAEARRIDAYAAARPKKEAV